MRSFLDIPEASLREVLQHLDPGKATQESAAFMVMKCERQADCQELHWIETHKLMDEHFAERAADYIEITDETRAGLIRRAHQLGGCLVEMHSHLGYWPAAFSEADLIGLSETVPHMLWRLPHRPYVAIVVARGGFDALVWDEPAVPMPIDALRSGPELRRPTNLSWTALQ